MLKNMFIMSGFPAFPLNTEYILIVFSLHI